MIKWSIIGLFIGLVMLPLGLMFTGIGLISGILNVWLGDEMFTVLFPVIPIGYLGLFFNGFQPVEMENKTSPNEGIWLTVKNAVIIALPIGLGVGLYSLIDIGIKHALYDGIGLLLVVGLMSGGFAFVKHFLLRFIFSVQGAIPFLLVPFFDYAAKLILLQKVGGGYIFIHRMLLEHFAAKKQ